MKLKVLPPTLRKNNRYLALDIKVKSVISKDDLVNIVWNGCIRFFGENGTGNFSLWVNIIERIFQFQLSVYPELSKPVRNLLKNKRKNYAKLQLVGIKNQKPFYIQLSIILIVYLIRLIICNMIKITSKIIVIWFNTWFTSWRGET